MQAEDILEPVDLGDHIRERTLGLVLRPGQNDTGFGAHCAAAPFPALGMEPAQRTGRGGRQKEASASEFHVFTLIPASRAARLFSTVQVFGSW